MIRYSTENDVDEIKSLMLMCFGVRDADTCVSNLNQRYLLKVVDNKIVAMTGLCYSDEFQALEVDWTCTHPDYRHMGYMQELFTCMLKDVKEDIYCSCWRLPNRDINLHTIMKMFDFVCILKPRVSWLNGHNCHRNQTDNLCVNCTGLNCMCWEDLYLREGCK